MRQDGNQSERKLRRPCSCPTCTIRSGKLFLRKRSRFLELIGSLVVAVLPTKRDIYEPIVYQLGYQEELSSAAACPRTQSIYITHGVSPWAADRTITGAKGKLYLRPASQLFSFSDHSGLMVASPGESLPTARCGAYHDALRQDSPSRGAHNVEALCWLTCRSCATRFGGTRHANLSCDHGC